MTQGNNKDYISFFKYLDHGFVGLIDAMPKEEGCGDNAIVDAARISYGMGTKKRSNDENLIRYLMRNNHTSPFEMVEFKFHLKMPIFVARQHIRHRTASVNEMSGRYSIMSEEFYIPDITDIGIQSSDNKQGRETENNKETDWGENIQKKMKEITKKTYETYNDLINENLARELARTVLPVSNYTQMIWKIDLNNLLKYLKLRLDSHAQKEIRLMAELMLLSIEPFVPKTIKAFKDYHLNSIAFSSIELDILKKGMNINDNLPKILEEAKEKLSKTELKEFLEKMNKLIS
jgi:thymidylate synthase (FAD)